MAKNSFKSSLIFLPAASTVISGVASSSSELLSEPAGVPSAVADSCSSVVGFVRGAKTSHLCGGSGAAAVFGAIQLLLPGKRHSPLEAEDTSAARENLCELEFVRERDSRLRSLLPANTLLGPNVIG